MKTKQNTETFINFDKAGKPKPKSLRPMRSLVAVRSLKPKTGVAVTSFTALTQTEAKN